MANKPIRGVGLGAASSVNLSQHTSLINKAWTSRHGLHDKQLAHHNQANVNSENNVCASTPRFHDDDGTAPLPFGSASRKITMPSGRLRVFLHSTTLKRQTVTLDHEATFVETWHVQFQTTHQNRCLHGFGECRGALIPHLVVVETEDRQGGVGLATLHRSDYTTQQTAPRMLPHNAPPAWSKFHTENAM